MDYFAFLMTCNANRSSVNHISEVFANNTESTMNPNNSDTKSE